MSNRLKYHSLSDYATIVQRNFFGVGGELNAAQLAYLTAVIRDRGEPEVWITMRGQDELLKLHLGGKFEIGQFNGTVTEILDEDLVFESAGERWLLSVGEPFSDAMILPPEY